MNNSVQNMSRELEAHAARLDRREFARLCAGSLLASGLTWEQLVGSDAPADIWGQTILPQPFDHEPFREVRVPAWVERTLGVGYTLSVMNEGQRTQAAQAGVTISELGFVDPFYAYYDSKLLTRRSPHVPLERTASDVAHYSRLGVKILGVYPPSLQSEVYELHPDWRLVSTDTREIPSVDLKAAPHGGMLCLLGPYGDFFIEVLAEILTQFPDVAAFSFDGLHYGGACYCQHCRAAFRIDTGRELPPRDMEREEFRLYQHWADRRMENLIQRMQMRLKGIKPDVALVTWTTNAGRFGHFLDIPRNMPARMNLLLDAPDMEFWLDETNRGASIVPAFGCAYMWAVTNHRVAFAEPYLMSRGNPYGKDSFPAHEIKRRMLLALTHGVGPSIAVLQPPHLQPAVYDCLAEVQRRAPWLTHKTPEPWAGLVMSDNTRCFYGRSSGEVEQRYMAHVFGAFRTGIEAHLPLTLLNDWNLTPNDLTPYKVLVLANTACLNEMQAQAIRDWVYSGGGLVASLDAGLCDEFGTPHPAPILADLFGIEHLGPAISDAVPTELDANFARTLPTDYWIKRRGVWDFEFQRDSFLIALQPLLGAGRVTFKGPAIRIRPLGNSQVIATLHPRPGAAGESTPAMVTNNFGAGRVVFCAAGFDAANYLTPYPYYREILRSAIEWAAGGEPPIRVHAPMCVHAVTMRQRHDGERLIIHLYNDVNTTAFHGLPADDVPLREEVIPIHDIQIALSGYKPSRVHLEPDGLELERKQAGERIEVTVPRLDIHCIVVAELG